MAAAKEKVEINFAPFQEVRFLHFSELVERQSASKGPMFADNPQKGRAHYVRALRCNGDMQVKPELATVSKVDQNSESFARTNYDVSCEVAVNEQVTYLASISLVFD